LEQAIDRILDECDLEINGVPDGEKEKIKSLLSRKKEIIGAINQMVILFN